MGAVRVRLLGGALNGQVLWVEQGRGFVMVHLGGDDGVARTLRYRIEGTLGHFEAEPETGPGLAGP